MAGGNREGRSLIGSYSTITDARPLGGKAKPLKAPKKASKELDEDDVAFREKQKAGKMLPSNL